MSFGEFYTAFKGLGDAFDEGQKQYALKALGTQLQAGDYGGAAKTAFNAGDTATGLSLLKLGQQQQAAAAANSAFGLLGASYGGGDASQPMTRSVERTSAATPSFLDTSSPSGQYTASLFKRESNNNDFAQAPTSSARGAGQFTRDTWNRVAAQNPGLNLTPVGNGQDGRTDRNQMVRATNALTAQNESVLQQSGLPVTDASRYALHFLGAGGGRRLVAGAIRNPDAPATTYANADQVAANRNVFFNRDGSPKSAGQVLNDFGRSFAGHGAVQQAQAPAAAPVAFANNEAQTQALEQSMGMVPPASAPSQVASADPEADLPAPGAQEAAFYVPGTDPIPTRNVVATGRVMQMPGEAPASEAASDKDQVSAQAPAQIAQAGLPQQAASAVGASAPGSQQRIGVLMRLAAMPGLSEGQSAVVKTLLSNELDQTKLPDTAKQYIFAKSAAGGGYDGTYAEFVNKTKDDGAKIQAQLQAREAWAKAHGMDPNDAGVQAWIMGGKTTSGHVLKPGDILAGPSGKTLAQNAATASSMDDDTANFLADRVLAGDTKALIGLGRGAQGAENLSKIQSIVAQKARAQGIDPTDIQQRAAEAAGLSAQARTLGTSAGRMTAAATEAEGAIALARQASAAVPRGSFVPLNRLAQAVQSNSGDPSLKAFNAANTTLVNTFARAVSPTGVGTVADKEHARELLSTADSPQAYEAVLQQMQKEIDLAHKAPERARTILEQERQTAKRGGQPALTMVPNPVAPDATPSPRATQPTASQFREGQTATAPGGQRVIFSRGQWVPLQAAPSSTASPQAGGVL